MSNESQYQAKEPNEQGHIDYSTEENAVWCDLYKQQLPLIEGRACNEFIKGLDILDMPKDRVPQLNEMSAALTKATGWSVANVPAIIPYYEFFSLLANRQFPAATFIRSREEFKYLKEPDIFHEFFGHCPILTDPTYGDFMQKYGEFGLKANDEEQILLARLYWFTVEFGLIKTPEGLRIYGGGILSSPEETVHCLESDIPERKTFDLMTALRTPYRIDKIQPIYFIIESYDELYQLFEKDLMTEVRKAIQLGDFNANFLQITKWC